VSGLTAGHQYTLYAYRGFNSFPTTGIEGYDDKIEFTATSATWSYTDPRAFLSDDAIYYIAVERTDRAVARALAGAMRQLECRKGGSSSTSFHATLDDSGWAPGSGYFTVTAASIMDNYHSAAPLVCVGNDFKRPISCVGYDNGDSGTLVQVTLTPTPTGLPTASYRFLNISEDPVARPPQTKGPWDCSVTVTG
jgi:hypothetical protein